MFAPWFGTMRWLLPFFLLAAGWWLEWGPGRRPGSGWGITVLGLAITYAGILGAAQVLGVSGGRIGRALAAILTDLSLPAGALIVLLSAWPPSGWSWASGSRSGSCSTPPSARPAGSGHDRRGSPSSLRRPTAPDLRRPPDRGQPTGQRARTRHRRSPCRPGRRRARPASGVDDDGSAIPAAIPSPRPDLVDVRPRPRRRRPPRRSWPRARCATPTTSPTPPTRRRPRSASSTSCRRSTTLDDIAMPVTAGGRRGGARAQRGDHRQEAGRLRHPGQDRRPQRRAGRHPVRGPAGPGRQGQPDRGAVRRPGDGPRRPLAADRGADPGQERGRHRDPEQGLQRRRPAADPRGGRLQGVGLDADLRARPRRGRQGPGGRPGQDAPPADRRRHRLGQERDGQRADHQPAVRGDAGRRADDPDGPQAGRAGRLQRPAAPARAGHHRARAGQGRAQVGGQRDGGALPAPGRRVRAQHPRVQRDPGRSRGPDALHRHHRRRARRPDDARGQERRGPDRPARPEGARDRDPHGPRHPAPERQRRDRPDQGQLPEPDRVRDGLADRLPDDPRHARAPRT